MTISMGSLLWKRKTSEATHSIRLVLGAGFCSNRDRVRIQIAACQIARGILRSCAHASMRRRAIAVAATDVDDVNRRAELAAIRRESSQRRIGLYPRNQRFTRARSRRQARITSRLHGSSISSVSSARLLKSSASGGMEEHRLRGHAGTERHGASLLAGLRLAQNALQERTSRSLKTCCRSARGRRAMDAENLRGSPSPFSTASSTVRPPGCTAQRSNRQRISCRDVIWLPTSFMAFAISRREPARRDACQIPVRESST